MCSVMTIPAGIRWLTALPYRTVTKISSCVTITLALLPLTFALPLYLALYLPLYCAKMVYAWSLYPIAPMPSFALAQNRSNALADSVAPISTIALREYAAPPIVLSGVTMIDVLQVALSV